MGFCSRPLIWLCIFSVSPNLKSELLRTRGLSSKSNVENGCTPWLDLLLNMLFLFMFSEFHIWGHCLSIFTHTMTFLLTSPTFYFKKTHHHHHHHKQTLLLLYVCLLSYALQHSWLTKGHTFNVNRLSLTSQPLTDNYLPLPYPCWDVDCLALLYTNTVAIILNVALSCPKDTVSAQALASTSILPPLGSWAWGMG